MHGRKLEMGNNETTITKFDEDKFEEYLGEFLWENDIYKGHAGWVFLKDTIDEDLKRNGLKSKYIRVAEPIVDSSENFVDADYYKINEYMDGIRELNKVQVYDVFISTHYFADEMKDPEIAPEVYSYIWYKTSDEEFRWFEDLRRCSKDAVDLDVLHKELGIEEEEERER